MPRLLVTLPRAAGIGGVEGYFADLCAALPALGWEVEALALPPPSPARPGGWEPPAYWDRVATVGRPWWSVRDFAAAARAAIRRRGPDVVLTFAYDAPLISGPNVPGGPRVVEAVHTGRAAEAARIRAWHDYFDALLAVSGVTAAAIERGLAGVPAAGRPPVRLIRYGLRLPPGEPGPRGEDPARPLRLIWFGRLHREVKRVLDLVPLCAALRARGVAFVLTVLGEGPEAPALRRALAAEVAAGRVVLAGAVPAEGVFGHLAGQDVFVSTSAFEGGPRTLIEAMACGVVPVVTDIAGYCREVVREGDDGHRVPVGDVAALADRVAALAADPPRRARMARSCRARVVPQFTLGRMAAATDAYFREVLAAPSRRRLGRAGPDLAAHLGGPRVRLPGPLRRGLRRLAWSGGLLEGLGP